MARDGYYDVDLIFRGLCFCVPRLDEASNTIGMGVFLVDGRNPQCASTLGVPFREHYPVLEFYMADLQNPGDIADLLPLEKPNKGRVGLYLLQNHDLCVSTSNEMLGPDFRIVDDEGENNYSEVPQIQELQAIGAENAGNPHQDIFPGSSSRVCAARVFLDRGEVRSERRSVNPHVTSEGQPQTIHWAFSEAHSAEPCHSPKPINLDVKVTFEVPENENFIIKTDFFGSYEYQPTFELRPSPGQKLQVWIKNREPELILRESDRLDEPLACDGRRQHDNDFEQMYRLCVPPMRGYKVMIHYQFDEDGGFSTGGCACGCSGGGSGSFDDPNCA